MAASQEQVDLFVNAYHRRETRPSDRHVLEILSRTGFLNSDVPLIDAGAGPSPHLAVGLLERLNEYVLVVNDWRTDFLDTHRRTYTKLTGREPTPQHGKRQLSWKSSGVHDDSSLVRNNAVLIHGVLPRLQTNTSLVLPTDHETMKRTLASLLDATPARVAMHLYGEHPAYPESPSSVVPALDALGIRYRMHEQVSSADFQPRPNGYLIEF